MDQVSDGTIGQAPTSEGLRFNSSGPQVQPTPVQNESIKAITKRISTYLEAAQTVVFTAPAGFDEALQALGPSDTSDTISKSFERCGFWPWLAYFLATKDVPHVDPILSSFPPDTLSEIAGHVSKVLVAPSLVKRIQNALWVARRGSTRRTQLHNAGIEDFPPVPPPSSTPSLVVESDSRKRPRVQSLDSPDELTDGTGLPSVAYNMTSDTTQTEHANSVCHPATGQPARELPILDQASQRMFNIDLRYNWAYPNASNIISVFEPELGDIIVRNGFNASIFASVPTDPAQCRLILDVEAPAVVSLAMKLYGAHIVETEQQRAFPLPGGASAVIIGSTRLIKTKLRVWDELLGNFVGAGVRNSQKCLDEAMRGFALSKCLSMEIPGAAGSPAQISLPMDIFTLNDIINKLWLS